MAGWKRPRWPDSLLGRIVLVMTVGVVSAQVLGAVLLTRQMRESVSKEALGAARNLANNAAGSIRFFRDLPPPYRPILIEQLRTMGGTRFFIQFNRSHVSVAALAGNALAGSVVQVIREELMQALATPTAPEVSLAWPENLQITDDGRMVTDLPESWVGAALLPRPRPAPIVVIQTEFERGHWLYLAATMPDPYFLDYVNAFTVDRVALQLVTLLTVLLLTVWLVRGLVKPIDRIADAANAFDSVEAPQPIPEAGTTELRRTARAFNAMQARIQGYMVDRERLFMGISHSLKTPIMRLKLRTELLDDEGVRNAFHEDLDDLDVMVKSALQSLRDTDIHENMVAVRLDHLLDHLVQRPIYPHAAIEYTQSPTPILGKPLALQRALGNLIDNAVLYGDRVQVRLGRSQGMAQVEIRDFGPGMPEASISAAFVPHVRLAHGRQRNRAGSGLGLGISRNIIQAHGGEIRLYNHPEGGLVALVLLPAMVAD